MKSWKSINFFFLLLLIILLFIIIYFVIIAWEINSKKIYHCSVPALTAAADLETKFRLQPFPGADGLLLSK